MKIQIKPLVINLAVSLGTGGLSALGSMNAMKTYGELNQPPLAPPAIVFPIVWTVLFLLMGISAYLICIRPSPYQIRALVTYGISLVFNFLWSILFFNASLFLFAFFWLIALWILIIVTIFLYHKIYPKAAWLQIPYLLWVTFAGYLNFMIYLLN